MTVRDDFDLTLTAWLDEMAGSGMPDYVDETLDGLWRLDRPPIWMRPGTWLASFIAVPRRSVWHQTPALLVLALLVAAFLVTAVLVGSRHELPPPLGLARSGLLAFEADGDIYLAQPDGRDPELFVGGPGDQYGATWSPDGTRLAYLSAPAAGSSSELWVVTPGASGPRKVVGDTASFTSGALVWSPAGRQLVIATGTSELWLIDVDGTGRRRLGDASLLYSLPSWSPDGTRIAVRAAHPSDELTYQGHVIGVEDDSEINLGSSMGSGIAHGGYAWSSDGKAVLYHLMRSEADLDIAIARLDPAGVWREDVLVAGPTRDVLPTWSNDGTHMAFIRTDGFGTPAQANQLMVANADGSSIHAIGDRPIDQHAPCWSPDDLSIGVTSYSSVDLRPVLVLVSMNGAQVEIPVPGRASAACSWQRLAP